MTAAATRKLHAVDATTLGQIPSFIESRPYDPVGFTHLIPQADDDNEYIQNPAYLELLDVLDAGCNVILLGPPGAGKTHGCFEVATKRTMPIFHVSHHAQIEAEYLLYRTVRNHETGQFEGMYGPLALSYPRRSLYVGDEATMSRPSVNGVYHSTMNTDPLSIINSSRVEQILHHPEQRMVLCINGDTCAGNYEMAEALADRAVTILWPYLDKDQEGTMLERYVPDSHPAKNRLADLITVARATRAGASAHPDARNFIFTHRRLKDACKLLAKGLPLGRAIRLAILNTCQAYYPAEELKTAEKYLKAENLPTN